MADNNSHLWAFFVSILLFLSLLWVIGASSTEIGVGGLILLLSSFSLTYACVYNGMFKKD